MITSLVFSKDRPLQLDLCLNSIKTNFIDCDEVYVIHNYTDQYQQSLNSIHTDHPDVNLIQQSSSIYEDVLKVCSLSKNNYVCFFTDDDIVYIKFNITGYDEIFQDVNQICCISLRLGLNITDRWHLGNKIEDKPLFYYDIGNMLLVSKTSHQYGSYWSYSHSLDGHIFRKSEIQNITKEISILNSHIGYRQTPNELEVQMQKFWTNSYNTIMCPKHSVVINTPNNRVSNSHQDNISGEKFLHDIDDLYYIYSLGKRIDINKLDFNQNSCPHTEINLMEGVV